MLDITDKSIKERVLGTVYLEVNPVKELTLKAVLGVDRKNQKRKQYVPTTTVIGAAKNGIGDIAQSDNMDYLFDLTATYRDVIYLPLRFALTEIRIFLATIVGDTFLRLL